MQRITPFLWYDTQAEEAAKFYIGIFSKMGKGPSKITGTSHYGDTGPGPAGNVMCVNFLLDGQEFIALNGGPIFKFTEAISLTVNCETQEEVDHFWNSLTSGGGEEVQCGWLKDKYGLSWQIVPTILNKLMEDPKRGNRVMQALMGMKKLDIEALKKA
jgi:predicted 3-demethylubiquinone-9 3-methyltransferase (glyoxalase superfamily)